MSARSILGAAAVGALMLGATPAFALNDPTPIGLPPVQPGGGAAPEFVGILGTPLLAHGFDIGVQFTY